MTKIVTILLAGWETSLEKRQHVGHLRMTAVLQTWGQTLTRHVHLHCLVPGGALSEQGQWNPATSTYLFPVRALSRHVRGGFVSRLRQASNDGRLAEQLHANLTFRLPGQPLSTSPLGADPNRDQGESR